MLPGTPRYGTVRVDAWHQVHPLIHGDRGWFAGWDGELPVLRGALLRVTVEHLPDGRKPHKTMWLWHAGPSPLSLDEPWRAYLARFDEEHAIQFAKGTLGLTAAKVRTPNRPTGGSAWSWPRTPSCSSPGRSPPTCAAPGKHARPPGGRSRRAGSAAGLPTSAATWEPPPMSPNPPGQDQDGRKAPQPGQRPATQSRRNRHHRQIDHKAAGRG
jgi:hypothetical protein